MLRIFKLKKIILIALLLNSDSAASQSLPQFDSIQLEKAADYKMADSFALQASVFLLSTHVDKNNRHRQSAAKFLFKWMAGTPDYSFSTDAQILKGNEDLIEIYLACFTKCSLENKSPAENSKQVKLNAVKLLLYYCEQPGNNVRMTAYLEKLLAANKQGTLEKEL